MKFSEIKENIINNSFTIDSICKRIYIPFLEKQVIAENVLNMCIDNVDGAVKNNVLDNQLFIDLKLISAYFEVENDSNYEQLIEFYDLLKSKGILTAMKIYVGEDWVDFENKLKDSIKANMEELRDKYMKENSVENQLKRFLEQVINNIPDNKKIKSMIKAVKKEFNSFKWEKNSVLGQVAKEYANIDLPNKEQVDKTIDIVEKFVDEVKK